MKFRWPWQNSDDDLDTLASELEALFQPVQPREEFVLGLRDNLVDQPKPDWLPIPKVGWQLILAIAGGVVSGLLLILGFIRVITNLFKRKKKKKEQDIVLEKKAPK